MKWETKQLEDGRWGIFLCKKYWKFKDRPVMYSAALNKRTAELRVERLNNPSVYSNDEKCVTVGMERERKKREKKKKLEKDKEENS